MLDVLKIDKIFKQMKVPMYNFNYCHPLRRLSMSSIFHDMAMERAVFLFEKTNVPQIDRNKRFTPQRPDQTLHGMMPCFRWPPWKCSKAVSGSGAKAVLFGEFFFGVGIVYKVDSVTR